MRLSRSVLASNSFFTAATTIGVLTVAGKAVSLAKELVVASRFGTGTELEAFLIAQTLPTFAINVAVGVLPMALTPAYVAARTQRGSAAAGQLAGTAFVRVYAVMASLAVLTALATMTGLHVPGFDWPPAVAALLPSLVWATAPLTLLLGASAAWSGVLAAEGAFVVVGFAPALLPAGMLIALFVVPSAGVLALAAGSALGASLQVAVLAGALRRRGVPLWAGGAALDAVRRQYLPAVGGAVFTSGNGLVDQLMASTLSAGAVATIGYGGKLVTMAMSLVIVAVGVPLLPHLSRFVEQADHDGLARFLQRITRLGLLITIPLAAALVYASPLIVHYAFERGAFTARDTLAVADVQSLYLLQLPGHVLAVVYARAIAALRATVWLTRGAVLALAVNVVANVVFMQLLGVRGLALSTALVHTCSALMLGAVVAYLLRAQAPDRLPVPVT